MTNATIQKINLTNIINVPDQSREAVRNIRNEEHVRKWMYTEHVISAEEHKKWLARLENDDRNLVFVVSLSGGEPLGVVSVNAIDRLHKKADWAYYLSDQARSGLGAVLEYHVINYVFDTLKLEKLNCEVIENNDAVVSLHRKFGFEEEGLRKSNIIKNGNRLGVYFLGLTSQAWKEHKPQLEVKYNKIFAKFAIEWR